MGGKVSTFLADVGKKIAKGATSAVGNMIPVVGPALADGLNSLYKGGGKVKPFAAGGEVPDGFKAKPINTASQLAALVKKFPDEAADAGLTLAEVKEHTMRRGGKRDADMVMLYEPLHARGGFANPINTLGAPIIAREHPVYSKSENSVF